MVTAKSGLAFLLLMLLAAACEPRPGWFHSPLRDQLSAPGSIAVDFGVSPHLLDGTLRLALDGEPIEPLPPAVQGRLQIQLPDVGVGWHELVAEARVRWGPFELPARTSVRFEAARITGDPGCELLNQAECLLPFPSLAFLETAATATGYRVALPAAGMPLENGEPLSPEPYRALDGFSPATQILMHFPDETIDLEVSGAPVLSEPSRTTGRRSLALDSPTVLVDLETGERILHFAELDATVGPSELGRRGLFLRPLANLERGRRYAVAVRGLRTAGGELVKPEPAFAALRDRRPSDVPAVEARRRDMERLFSRLKRAGVARADLILAFEFVVWSEETSVRNGVAMRDAAFAWLDARIAAGEPLFEIDLVEDRACTGDELHARVVEGRFPVPLFLSEDLVADPQSPGHLVLGPDGNPAIQKVVDAPFAVSLPCSLAAEPTDSLRPVVVGHGGFGFARNSVTSLVGELLASLRAAGEPHSLVPVATDQWGFSRNEGLPSEVAGFFALQWFRKDRFGALPDRNLQGALNSVLLARLVNEGLLQDKALTLPDGRPLFPGGTGLGYAGYSAGGDIGPVVGALSPDLEAVHLAVGGSNEALQFPRNRSWGLLDFTLELTQGSDPLRKWVTLGLLNELWTRGVGAAYAPHVRSGALADGYPKRVLMTSILYDANVPQLASTFLAASLGLPSIEGSILPGRAGIPDTTGPQASGLIFYDTGLYSPDEPADQPFIPPLDNRFVPVGPCFVHGKMWEIPAAGVQIRRFLEAGGRIEPTCDGACDADVPLEQVIDEDPC